MITAGEQIVRQRRNLSEMDSTKVNELRVNKLELPKRLRSSLPTENRMETMDRTLSW